MCTSSPTAKEACRSITTRTSSCKSEIAQAMLDRKSREFYIGSYLLCCRMDPELKEAEEVRQDICRQHSKERHQHFKCTT